MSRGSQEYKEKCEKEEKIEKILKEALNEALESVNADGSFKVVKTDLDTMKFTVEFDIVEVPEDNYIGFVEY